MDEENVGHDVASKLNHFFVVSFSQLFPFLSKLYLIDARSYANTKIYHLKLYFPFKPDFRSFSAQPLEPLHHCPRLFYLLQKELGKSMFKIGCCSSSLTPLFPHLGMLYFAAGGTLASLPPSLLLYIYIYIYIYIYV